MQHILPSSSIFAFVLCSLMGMFFFPALLWADSVDARAWEITADKLTRHEDPPSFIAEGNVILEKKDPVATNQQDPQEGQLQEDRNPNNNSPSGLPTTDLKTVTTIKANWVSYDIVRGLLTMKGDLLITLGADQLTADSGTIDLEKATGSFENATVIRQQNEMHFEGKRIEKTGELTYHIEHGWIVTCKLQPGETSPWSFAADDVNLTDGGYAYLSHATFRIKDVPVLYTPVMLLPAKRERQSGFLFPNLSFSSRDGAGLETPFFVNLSPNTDLTLYPHYFSSRGMMHGAEFRYVSAEDSKGMLTGNYLNDALSHPSEVSYYQDGNFTHTNTDRYWIRGKADQNIGAWTTRIDIDIASDLDYLREFNSGSTGFDASQKTFLDAFGRGFIDKTNKYRENTLSAVRSWENGAGGSTFLVDAMAVNDTTEQVYAADNPSRAWTLPSLTYSRLVPLATTGNPDLIWNSNYTNFWRDKGAGAQRLDLMPTISTGIPLSSYVEAAISGGVRNTSYTIQDNDSSDWKETDTANRFLSHFDSEIGTTLMRDFAIDIGEANTLNHALRPFIAYSKTSIPDKKLLPQFDTIDKLEEENAIYYGVNNFFALSGEHKGHEVERDYAFFKVKQGYNLQSDQSDRPLTPVLIETGFYPVQRVLLKYSTKIDMYGDGAFFHAVDSTYFTSRGDSISVDYRYNELVDTNSITGSFWYILPYNFAVGYSLQEAIAQNKTIEEIARLRYIQPCWSMEFSTNTTPGNENFMLTFRLANLAGPLGFALPGR